MTNTIVASSHIVTSERSSLRAMKRAIGSSRRPGSWSDGTGAPARTAAPTRRGVRPADADERNIWPRALE